VSGMKRRFSTRQVGRGKPGPGAVYEVVVRGFDPRGYLVRESTVISSTTGSDGPATRAEAQRHAGWLNYADECFYAGRPVPPIYEWPITGTEVDAPEAERRLAVAMVAGHEAADGVAGDA
jgi:hypothetical protein